MPSRDVDFTSPDGFLGDLALDREKVECNVVRIEVAVQQRNQGVCDVFLKAGFLVDGSRRQLIQGCGEAVVTRGDMAGDGMENAAALLAELTAKIEHMGFQVREGGFV